MQNNNKDIEQEAPILFGIEKKHNLNTPKGYFENLPNQLQNIAAKPKNKVISMNRYWIYASAIAAVIIAGVFIFTPSQNLDKELIAYNETFNNLTAENFEDLLIFEQEEFLSENIDFDDTDEMQFLASELQKPLQETEITEQDFENYFESEIEEYY